AGGLYARGDAVQHFLPARLAPGIFRPPVPYERMQQALWVADDFPRGLAAHAQKSLAVGVVLIARDEQELPVLDYNQHAAQGRVTAHRTHRANDSTSISIHAFLLRALRLLRLWNGVGLRPCGHTKSAAGWCQGCQGPTRPRRACFLC